MSNSSFRPIERTLSGATILSQNGSGSDSNEGVLCIPQISSNTGASPSDCQVSYVGHSLSKRGCRIHRLYLCRCFRNICLKHLQRYSRCILQPQLTGLAKKEQNVIMNMKTFHQIGFCVLFLFHWS